MTTIAAILKQKGSQVLAVSPDDTIGAVARTLAQHRIGAALVREAGGAVAGILSERDIVRALAGQGEATIAMTAAQLMTRVLHTATPRTTVAEALGMMTDRRIRHLPVMDEAGALAGMISIGDLVKARIAEAEHEAESLRAYVVSAG